MAEITRRHALLAGAGLLATPAIARAEQAPGITATEILLGQTMPYSGPASSYAPIAFSQLAYIDQINEQGGVNGRKIKVISLDDGYSPPKTVEQTRRLVEQDQVAAIYLQLGTPTATATRKYLNQKKVPQIFIASGATQFGDRENYPWSIGWQPSYQIEGRIYGKYLLANKPDAKIAVLYQNDDSGRDYYKGFRDGLGSAADARITKAVTFEVTDPTVDSQVLQLRESGADTLFVTGVPKFQAMTIRKVYDTGWRPTYIMTNVGSSVASGINPAGPEKAVGYLTAAYMRDPTNPNGMDTPQYKEWLAFMRKRLPQGDITDINNVYGYSAAQTLIPALHQCGEDLSRENIMKQAANVDIQLPMVHDGIRFTTTATDYYGFKRLRMQRFDGKGWVPFGEPIG